MPTIHDTTVIARAAVTARMLRLTLAGPSLVGLNVRPAQDIELLLGERDGRPIKRRYTVRRARPGPGELDLEVLLHDGGGPGSTWAAQARPGTPARFAGPKGKLELRPADWHLFVGDEASLPAIAALTEALPAAPTTVVLVEVNSPDDQMPLTADVVRWLCRAGDPPGTCAFLAPALEELRTPAGLGHAYLLGESHSLHTLRGYLSAHRITPDQAFVKGYWNA